MCHASFTMDGLRKLIRICTKSGFFSAQISENSLESIQYRPLGSLLRRNVWSEWLSSNINNTDVYMFPLDTKNDLIQSQSADGTECPLLPDVLRKYSREMPFIGMDNPFGFAVYGSCMGREKRKTEVLLTDSFLSIPSKFSMSDVSETTMGDQQMFLMMKFPWGKEKLESVTLCKDNQCSESSLIVCQTELDLATIANLSNSLDEKWREGAATNLFQLHVKLAPYKVCLSVDGKNSPQGKKLIDVTNRLTKELKKCQVAVFPYVSSCHSQWSRLDEMGIPYTILLNERALQTGVVGLRSRDTSLEEQIHITELTPKLLKYLQMKSHHEEEF